MMKNRISCYILVLFLSAALYSCKDKVIVSFTYEPQEPKIGESVQFTNLSDGGESFDWTFQNEITGSVTRSTAKNPTRTFTVPGDYIVKLRVDSNDHFVAEKRLYVYDSIPTIKRNKETVTYYGNVKFSTIAYNPYNRAKKYQWFFSEYAHMANGAALNDTVVTIDGSEETLYVSYEAEPEVFFNRIGTETVYLQMSVGDSVYTADRIKSMTVAVEDEATRSLLMARKGGNILRQRIFENGVDVIETTSVNAGARPFNIVSHGEQLFVFDAGTEGQADGSIRVVNLNTDKEEIVMTMKAGMSSDFGFYNGYVDDNHIYWTDKNDFAYSTPKSSRGQTLEAQGDERFYLADASLFADKGMAAGQYNGGIYAYNGMYYWAKGGDGKGLYRFKKSGDAVSDVSVILGHLSIRTFVHDRNNGQIYFAATAPADSIGLWVSDWDGSHIRSIDTAPVTDPEHYITGITLDYKAGKVLWADATGVKQIKIIRSDVQNPETPTYFNEEKGILGIALDNVEKIGEELH